MASSTIKELDDDSEIIEGLLCPVCMHEFPSILQLQAHFEEEHNAIDNDVIHSIKGFFNKAKKIILKDEDSFDSKISPKFISAFPHSLYEEDNPWHWEPLTSSPSRSHYAQFKKIRSARIDSFAAETNKLLIRLDKILTNLPSDPVKRKVHEKNIVPWASDKDVPLCPFCAKGFNIGRRRHHCRLCGAIMCDECSEFLPEDFAKKLASILHSKQGNYSNFHHSPAEGSRKSSFNSLGSIFGSFPLRRSGSQGSLNSLFAIVDSIGKESALRICSHCMQCLTSRRHQMNRKSTKPLLLVYYSKLMESHKTLKEFIPQFVEMCDSLNAGESTFHLKEAEEMRMKILKLSDTAKMTAQKILELGKTGVLYEENVSPPAEEGTPDLPGTRQMVLQKRIYSSTVAFLKDNVLALPKVPTPEEYTRQKERKKQDAEIRLVNEREAERRAAMVLRKNRGSESPRGESVISKTSSSSQSPLSSGISSPRKKPPEISIDGGWFPENITQNVIKTDHPLIQQMNIIRNSIKQAKSDGRLSDLPILETNLRELQSEFRRLQSAAPSS